MQSNITKTEVLALNVTAEERIMYSVMKAVYDSGIPISFKGSMVLKACLFEAGFLDETRHTVDIDANWNTDTPPTAEQWWNPYSEQSIETAWTMKFAFIECMAKSDPLALN